MKDNSKTISYVGFAVVALKLETLQVGQDAELLIARAFLHFSGFSAPLYLQHSHLDSGSGLSSKNA